jgi:hypothetical protein
MEKFHHTVVRSKLGDRQNSCGFLGETTELTNSINVKCTTELTKLQTILQQSVRKLRDPRDPISQKLNLKFYQTSFTSF